MPETKTIDITPGRAAQIAIAARFIAQVLADVKPRRAKDDDVLLGSFADIVFTLGFNAPRHTIEAALAEKEAILNEIFER